MTIDAGTVTWLLVGAILLGALAVVIDRVNFPQKPFRPKRIETGDRGAARDRTGAHIVDDDDSDYDYDDYDYDYDDDDDGDPDGSVERSGEQSTSSAEGEVGP